MFWHWEEIRLFTYLWPNCWVENGDGNGKGKRLDLSVLVEDMGKRVYGRRQDSGRSRLRTICPQHTEQYICGLLLPFPSLLLSHFFLNFSISLYTLYPHSSLPSHQRADRPPLTWVSGQNQTVQPMHESTTDWSSFPQLPFFFQPLFQIDTPPPGNRCCWDQDICSLIHSPPTLDPLAVCTYSGSARS